MTDHKFRVGDIVDVYDRRDGALVESGVKIIELEQGEDGIIASLTAGFRVSVRCLKPHGDADGYATIGIPRDTSFEGMLEVMTKAIEEKNGEPISKGKMASLRIVAMTMSSINMLDMGEAAKALSLAISVMLTNFAANTGFAIAGKRVSKEAEMSIIAQIMSVALKHAEGSYKPGGQSVVWGEAEGFDFREMLKKDKGDEKV